MHVRAAATPRLGDGRGHAAAIGLLRRFSSPSRSPSPRLRLLRDFPMYTQERARPRGVGPKDGSSSETRRREPGRRVLRSSPAASPRPVHGTSTPRPVRGISTRQPRRRRDRSRGLSARQPRRRRDSSPRNWNVHVAATASPRLLCRISSARQGTDSARGRRTARSPRAWPASSGRPRMSPEFRRGVQKHVPARHEHLERGVIVLFTRRLAMTVVGTA